MGTILFACADNDLAHQVEQVVFQASIRATIIVSNRATILRDIQNLGKEIDVIVSRGALGQYIAQHTEHHVILMRISVIDVLNKAAELKAAGAEKIAVIGSSAWLGEDTGQHNHEVFGCHFLLAEDNEARATIIATLKSEGYDALITVGSGIEQAKQHGLLVRELSTTMHSIQSSLQEAHFITEIIREERLKTKQIRFLLDNSDDALVLVSGNQVGYANNRSKELFASKNISINELQPYLNLHNETGYVHDTQVLINSTAYSIGDEEFGQIISLKKISSIHKTEQIVRGAQRKGFVAKYSFYNIVSESPTMARCVEKAMEYAQFDSSILITGETGTGKEILAQSIHNASSRRNQPFVSINCAAIPASLLESELFGYVDGAFTGAKKGGKYGVFELAHNGTLLLDEIGEMPIELQSRILRVLQEKELMRIGDDKIIPVNVRVICATNKDLLHSIDMGTFRADLYYRINVLRLSLEPLRHRKADICPLFDYHLHLFNTKYEKNVHLTHPDSKAVLESYRWPGNIRELANIAERAVVLCKEDELSSEFLNDLLGDETNNTLPVEKRETAIGRAKVTSTDVEKLLQIYSNSEVCEMLGISRTTLWRILNQKAK